MGIGTGHVAVEDDGAGSVDGEETRAVRGEAVVGVGLTCRHVDAARSGHRENAVGGVCGRDRQVATGDTKGDAAGKDIETADAAEVVVGADAEDTAVDRGGTEVGVGVS